MIPGDLADCDEWVSNHEAEDGRRTPDFGKAKTVVLRANVFRGCSWVAVGPDGSGCRIQIYEKFPRGASLS
jgi:hypothetical protein